MEERFEEHDRSGLGWHASSADSVLKRLESSPEGLSVVEAERRLGIFGPNSIEEEKRVSPLLRFLAQFRSPLIYILLVAAIISFALRETIDGEVILLIVFFNAIVGFVQEQKAESALGALSKLTASTAKIIREGEESVVQAAILVPGDVIAVDAGDRVPADARILSAARLRVDESILTGESVPSQKSPDTVEEDSSISERLDMLYAGTSVTSGRGRGVVIATGTDTETGRIALQVQSTHVLQTPLQEKLAQVGKWLATIGVAIAFVLVGIGFLRGMDLYSLFFTAVAAAVAFIPEGLPAVVTIVLALGVERMARRNAIIRKLPAVETLGSATVICTDKTGTLTRNEMTVQACYVAGAMYTVTGTGYDPAGEFLAEDDSVAEKANPALSLALTAAVLCNDAKLMEDDGGWKIFGDPTEGALLTAGMKLGIRKDEVEEQRPRIDELPFESETKYMATLNGAGEGSAIFVKGAPEVVAGMCGFEETDEGVRPLSSESLEAIKAGNRSMAEKGFRVLSVAYKSFEGSAVEIADVQSDLVFLGLFGMLDPIRSEVYHALDQARDAGIRVVMITGDNAVTAESIGRSLGLLDKGRVVSGRELQKMTDEEFSTSIEDISVFARVDPEHKYRIVETLQKKNELVAMTGDGVNDAPALKKADIGIAMGRDGTDVAREAADVVLADDNFATIIGAVEEGRTIFDNLRKIVQYLLATNSGEILTFLAAMIVGLPLPLIPVQILWVNLVTDGFATVPLAVEPEEGDVMRKPPRNPREPVVTRRSVLRIGMVATVMAAGTLGLFIHELKTSDMIHARTMAFATLAIFQLFNTFNARSSVTSIFRLGFLSNKALLVGVGLSFILQIAVTHVGFLQRAFETTALSRSEWGLVLGISSSVLILEELRKAVFPKAFESNR